jgi:NADPH-dependent glutamate synthase beta chain and related oxidoreductases
MFNSSNKKTPCEAQPTSVSIHNFNEVNSTYSEKEAVIEASRCLNCKDAPCIKACPLHNNIPLFIKYISEQKFLDAYNVDALTNPMGNICGRVCGETFCEAKCIRGINPLSESVAISRLERFLGDKFADKNSNIIINKNDKSVGIVGSGPSGLACAESLIKKGYQVTVFEKERNLGGLLVSGIPNFCLPRSIVDNKINYLKKLGVTFISHHPVGVKEKLTSFLVKEKFDALFIATGCNQPKTIGMKNESARGVYDAKKYLEIINLPHFLNKFNYADIFKAKNVIVVGGGNVAIDVDRCAIRLGAKTVHNLYRRSEAQMPARKEDYKHAIEEGVIFDFLTNPSKIVVGNEDRVYEVNAIKMTLGEIDASGRQSAIPVPNSEFTLPCDLLVFALGSIAEDEITKSNPELRINCNGFIYVDPITQESNLPNIYCGGDNVIGPSFVVQAINSGLIAAKNIDEKLSKK